MTRLRVTIGLLIVLLTTLGLAQRRSQLWPVVLWPMYSEDRPAPVASTTSILEVRAHTRGGGVEVLRSEDLVEHSRGQLADVALRRSVDHAEDRAYLLRLVDIAVSHDVERAELWRVTWRVDASDVPPLDRHRPVSERRLAVLRGDATAASP